MKKLLVYFLLFTISIISFTGCFADSKSYMTGIYLRSINGSNIIIDEDNIPICMDNKTGMEDIFRDLNNGDKIEVAYDTINETYPAETKIYNCKLIERGSINNIPKDALEKLEEMGWVFDLSN